MIQVTFSINLVYLHFMRITKYEFLVHQINLSAIWRQPCYISLNIYISVYTHICTYMCIHIGLHICQGIIIMYYDIVHRNCVTATGRAHKLQPYIIDWIAGITQNIANMCPGNVFSDKLNWLFTVIYTRFNCVSVEKERLIHIHIIQIYS